MADFNQLHAVRQHNHHKVCTNIMYVYPDKEMFQILFALTWYPSNVCADGILHSGVEDFQFLLEDI